MVPNTPFPIPETLSGLDAAKMIYNQALQEGIALPPEPNEALRLCGATFMSSDAKMNPVNGIVDGRAILVSLGTFRGGGWWVVVPLCVFF